MISILLMTAALNLTHATEASIDCRRDFSWSEYGWGVYHACGEYLEGRQSPHDKLVGAIRRIPDVIEAFDPEGRLPASQSLLQVKNEAEQLKASLQRAKEGTKLLRARIDTLSGLLRKPGKYRLCPREIFRECTVIALSVDEEDGALLDGRAPKVGFRVNDDTRAELLRIFMDSYVGAPILGEIDEALAGYEAYKVEYARGEAYASDKLIPALVSYMKDRRSL